MHNDSNTTAPCRVCLVRHGETDWNAQRRLQGQRDNPLNATGLAQAGAAARALQGERFAAVYTSDLARAHQTARVIGYALEQAPQVDRALRERCFGVLEGLTSTEARTRHPCQYSHFETRDLQSDLDGGEPLDHFARRAIDCIDRLALHHPGRNIVVVTHGGVLDVIYRHATGRPLQTPRDFDIPNAGVNWLEIGTQGWTVQRWAERAHLTEAKDVYL